MKKQLGYSETHQKGHLSLENEATVLGMLKENKENDVGIMISPDGRIWLCVNGVAFIRFKPVR